MSGAPQKRARRFRRVFPNRAAAMSGGLAVLILGAIVPIQGTVVKPHLAQLRKSAREPTSRIAGARPPPSRSCARCLRTYVHHSDEHQERSDATGPLAAGSINQSPSSGPWHHEIIRSQGWLPADLASDSDRPVFNAEVCFDLFLDEEGLLWIQLMPENPREENLIDRNPPRSLL